MATYLPGGRVDGVVVRDGAVEVHVVAAIGPPLPGVADGVRDAVRTVSGGRDVVVVIADLADAPV